jgi:hypothetical protein
MGARHHCHLEGTVNRAEAINEEEIGASQPHEASQSSLSPEQRVR